MTDGGEDIQDNIDWLITEVRRLSMECIKFHSNSGCDLGSDDCEWCDK